MNNKHENTDLVLVLNNEINITPLLKAYKTLQQALASTKTGLERDGAIQRFEYTFELVWKTLRRLLLAKGLEVNNPRDVFRDAARQGWLQDPTIWFEFLKKRNLTVYTYNQECAEEIFAILAQFNKEVSTVIEAIKKL